MSFSANYPTTAPSLLLDFANSNTVDPRVTFTRASTATYFNSIGSLTTAAINSPRLDYDPTTLASQGLLIEESRTNSIRNNTMVGAAVGTPGAAPTNWFTFTPLTGLTQSIVGVGTENGITYIDVRLNGTPSGAGQWQIAAENSTSVVASNGQAWTFSSYYKLAAGSLAGISTTQCSVNEYNAVGGYLDGTFVTVAAPSSVMQRASVSRTFTNASTARVFAPIFLNLTGAAIDITLRIGLPQLELGAFATSVIPTSPTFTSRASTGTFFDSTGTLQTAAINVARNNYNPASLSTPPLLLIEEARTNSIRNNTGVGAVAGTPGTLPTNWALGGISGGLATQVVGTGSENGITYIDIRIFGTNSSGSSVFPGVFFDTTTGIPGTTGQVWNESLYLSLVAGTGISFELAVHEADSGGVFLRATTLAGTPGAPTTGALNTRRRAGSVTLGASTAFVRPVVASTVTNGASVDFTLRIGLPQLELGAYPTSVIPTTTVAVTRSADLFTQAAVTRSADVASVNTLSPWYNQSEGTVYAESAVFSVNTQTQLVWQVLGGADSTSLRSPQGTVARLRATVGNTFSGAVTGPNITNNTPIKSAVAWQGLSGRLQSGATGEDVTAATTVSATQLNIGNLAGGSFLNGYIRRITYYPIRLSNANLQALTS